MLVGDFIFLEEFLHLLGDHVAVVGDRDERDLFPSFRLLRFFGRFRLFWILSHS